MRASFACATSILLSTAGCLIVSRHQYVLNMNLGSPPRVESWTMRQTDGQRIMDGMAALLDIVQDGNPKQRSAAASGYVRVHRKLERGWPGFVGAPNLIRGAPGAPAGSRLSIEDQIDRSYGMVAGRARTHTLNADLRELYSDIAPPESETRRYGVWKTGIRMRETTR